MSDETKSYIRKVQLADGTTRYIKADADGDGNEISSTYATKAQLQPIMPTWPSTTNGEYLLHANVVNGVATYNWIDKLVPPCPTTKNSTFVLQATVANGAVTYEWVEGEVIKVVNAE